MLYYLVFRKGVLFTSCLVYRNGGVFTFYGHGIDRGLCQYEDPVYTYFYDTPLELLHIYITIAICQRCFLSNHDNALKIVLAS